MSIAKAIRIREPGGPDVLELGDIEVPNPSPTQVSVEVAAAGLNRADCLQRRGFYPAPPGVPPDVPGLEFAGIIDSVGAAVAHWKPGDRVMGIVGGGAMATAGSPRGRAFSCTQSRAESAPQRFSWQR